MNGTRRVVAAFGVAIAILGALAYYLLANPSTTVARHPTVVLTLAPKAPHSHAPSTHVVVEPAAPEPSPAATHEQRPHPTLTPIPRVSPSSHPTPRPRPTSPPTSSPTCVVELVGICVRAQVVPTALGR